MAKPGYEDRSGPFSSRWSDDRMINADGYVKLRVGKDHPLADPNGYAYEHLVIWGAAGNPRPPRGWLLHHRNEVKSDNRLSNIELKEKDRHGIEHASPLTDAEVVEIRVAYDTGAADTVGLGKTYKVPAQTVWKLIRGITRKAAGGPIQTGSLRSRRYG